MTDKITLTRLELKTIIEDAFIDGWNTKDCDWVSPEGYLAHHEEFGDCCETTEAIRNLMKGE